MEAQGQNFVSKTVKNWAGRGCLKMQFCSQQRQKVEPTFFSFLPFLPEQLTFYVRQQDIWEQERVCRTETKSLEKNDDDEQHLQPELLPDYIKSIVNPNDSERKMGRTFLRHKQKS